MNKSIKITLASISVASVVALGITGIEMKVNAQEDLSTNVSVKEDAQFTDLGTLNQQQRYAALQNSDSILTPEGNFQKVNNDKSFVKQEQIATDLENVTSKTEKIVLGNAVFVKVQ